MHARLVLKPAITSEATGGAGRFAEARTHAGLDSVGRGSGGRSARRSHNVILMLTVGNGASFGIRCPSARRMPAHALRLRDDDCSTRCVCMLYY